MQIDKKCFYNVGTADERNMSVTSGLESFWRNVEGLNFKGVDPVEELLLREYGAIFAARGVVRPDRVLFDDEAGVRKFQARVESESAFIGGHEIVLQRAALEALLNAIETARRSGLDITPRGADSAKRSYAETVELW